MLIGSIANAQNLVPNYSFELMDSCPNNIGQLDRLKRWFNPTYNSPDYFNSCSIGPQVPCGIPSNYWGWQLPRTGNAYAGFGSKTNSGREYLSVKLNDSLFADTLYCLSAWVSAANHARYSIGCIGFHFSASKITVDSFFAEVLEVTPQFFNPI